MTNEHHNKGGSYLVEKEGATPKLVHRTKTAEEAELEKQTARPAAPTPKATKDAGTAGKGDEA